MVYLYKKTIMQNKKGCVYFFKHIGLSPIKIGFTANESPFSRFGSFKTYAPYGSELVGFIRTETPLELEQKLHAKFETFRIEGEWFEITIELAKKTIEFYSNILDIQEMNNFQVEWAKSLIEKKHKYVNFEDESNKFFEFFSLQKTENATEVFLCQREIAEIVGISHNKLRDFFKSINLIMKAHHVKDADKRIKKGYKIYRKTVTAVTEV